MIRPRPALLLAVLLPFVTHIAAAQTVPSSCPAPPAVFQSTQPNIFTEQQEQWLGDAMADMIESNYKPVQDPVQNEYLARITKRLLATLPATNIQFRVLLLDSSEVNAFSLAGGHVYITRKLVANAHSEDEVASVIAHEMGHILSHQFAVETTADLKRLLGVVSVGDKADIYTKFQRLLDARLKDKHSSGNNDSDAKQNEADQVAVYAAAAAGYRPQAYAEYWDRMFFVDGKLGGPLSDFFGITKPASKRLRAILKLVAALPPGCGAAQGTASPEFQQWLALVIANQPATVGLAIKPSAEVALTPPLRMDLERLRFSRDGKYILAQDESSIAVLTRDPYKLLFRFDAESALPAEFSPDSQHIVFNTGGLHTEEWSIPDQKLVASHEPVIRQDCLQTKFSPDGRTLFCVSSRPASMFIVLDLTMIDAATGNVLYQKKEFFTPTFGFLFAMALSQQSSVPVDLMPGSFSGDGNILLFGPESSKLAFDLRTRAPISITGGLKSNITGAYAFVGNDKVLGVGSNRGSAIYSFPDGKLLAHVPFSLLDFEPVTSGNYVISHDIKDFAVGLIDISAERFIVESHAPSLDVWNNWMLTETSNGSVLLRNLDTKDVAEKDIVLPLSPLGENLRAFVSSDRRFLAISTRTRSAFWDLTSGKQILVASHFNSAVFTPDNTLYLEFPKIDKKERGIYRLSLQPLSIARLTYAESDTTALSSGMLHEWKTTPGKKGIELIIHDVRDNSELWHRTFDDGKPAYTANLIPGQILLSFPLSTLFARQHLKDAKTLASQASTIKNHDDGRLIQVLDKTNGNVLHELVIEVPPNYEGVDGINIVGDSLYLSSSDNRTMIYSLSTAAKLRQVFGYVIAADPVTGYICTTNRRDEAVVYDGEGHEMANYRMGSPLRFATFKNTGHTGVSLILLTADQKVRTMDIPSAAHTQSSAAAAEHP